MTSSLARVFGKKMAEAPDRRAAMDQLLHALDADTRAAVQAELLAPDPDTPPVSAPPLASEANDCPPLPADARHSVPLARECGEWVDEYTRYGAAISPMTPDLFHESAAYFLGSAAIARRLVVEMPHGPVYPNQSHMWIAETTLWRKSTALDIPERIARRHFPYLLAAQESTHEALLADLAGCEPPRLDAMSETTREAWKKERDFAAQKALILDEASGLLASTNRDYNAGMVECLMRLYDCEALYKRSTRGQGLVVIRDAYLGILGASTPLALARHLMADQLWSNGWWPRFALLCPETDRPEWKVARSTDEPRIIGSALNTLLERLPAAKWPDPPEALTVSLGSGVYDAFERYSKATTYDLLVNGQIDHRLKGTYGRLATHALKLATILAALDWSPASRTPRIEMPHFARAQNVAESWRASAHRVLRVASHSEFDALRQRLIKTFVRAGTSGATVRDICRAHQDRKPDDIGNTVRQMLDAGDIEQIESNPNEPRQRGRPTQRYRIVEG